MRTEIINLIKSLKEHGDTHSANKHLAVLEHNFTKLDKDHPDYRFIKRILAIFFPSNPNYQSEQISLDPLEILTKSVSQTHERMGVIEIKEYILSLAEDGIITGIKLESKTDRINIRPFDIPILANYIKKVLL